MALAAVFLFATAFYICRAAEAQSLSLHDGTPAAYNQLAEAFLHFRLWVAHLPASKLSPASARSASLYELYWDRALHNGYVYLTWGPTPALVLLVPLHLLGFEPSDSLILTPFAVAGLAFALASLRVILRQIGEVSLWLCSLAALVLASASVVPFLMQSPDSYVEAVAGGYCFAMAGIWLALTAIVEKRTSPMRLGLASLCFGLAVGSRPTLILTTLTLLPVCLSLRPIRQHRGQLAALALPLFACLILLAAYNTARFGNPLEVGTRYQINSIQNAHWGELSYMPPGLWSYLIAPPRLNIFFPFLSLIGAAATYPFSLSAQYGTYAEPTVGLLITTPITVFLVALPWLWRRRPALLGPLGLPLMLMVPAALAILAFLTYYFFGTSERYQVDYATLLLLGALAVWLSLSAKARGHRRRLVRIGGGLLAAWSCAAGVALAYQETGGAAAGTWRTLVNLSSPLSTAIATGVGHAVLAEVSVPTGRLLVKATENYGNVADPVTGFWLARNDQVALMIISPDNRRVAVAGRVYAGPSLRGGARLNVQVSGPGPSSSTYQLPTKGREVLIPVELSQGINRVSLRALPTATNAAKPSEPTSRGAMIMLGLHLAGN